jgi:hypothetical protein
VDHPSVFLALAAVYLWFLLANVIVPLLLPGVV